MATVENSTPKLDPLHAYMDGEGFPWLENGARMTQPEFHERYKKLPPDFKAELIGGVVYIMASPLSNRHARNDFPLIGWLYVYSASTPGTVGQCNATTILGQGGELQPDSALLILPSHGGQTRDGEDGFTHGAPELVVEVAWSSQSVDLVEKLREYERAGVQEYLVRDVREQKLHWFELVDGKLRPRDPDPDGIFRSRTFPGLWLDSASLIAGDQAAVLAALQRGLQCAEHAAFVAELERRRAEKA